MSKHTPWVAALITCTLALACTKHHSSPTPSTPPPKGGGGPGGSGVGGAGGGPVTAAYPKFQTEQIDNAEFINRFVTEAGFCKKMTDGSFASTHSAKSCTEEVPSVSFELEVMGGNLVNLQLIKKHGRDDAGNVAGRFLSASIVAIRVGNPVQILGQRIILNGDWEKMSDATTDIRVEILAGELMGDPDLVANVYLGNDLLIPELHFTKMK